VHFRVAFPISSGGCIELALLNYACTPSVDSFCFPSDPTDVSNFIIGEITKPCPDNFYRKHKNRKENGAALMLAFERSLDLGWFLVKVKLCKFNQIVWKKTQ
jgi:hypothetical protein